jgi:HEAT repeats
MAVVLGAAAPACVATGVPTWAMHVRPTTVNTGLDSRTVRANVAWELAQPGLRQGHIAPEQIALVAVEELRARRFADAGLWLSIASYRYHQEALLAGSVGKAGFDTLPPGVRVDMYEKLVIAEIKGFAHLDFNDEMEIINARMSGRGGVESALQEELTGLGKTSPIDRESLRDVLAELRPNAGPAAEVTRYPELIDAFRRRLLDDFRQRGQDRNPGYYLAWTPVAALQAEAVLASVSAFEPGVCSGVALAFPAPRRAMIAALDHKRPEVRANAAATLGLAPSEETRPILEAHLRAESDPRVKLALAFALVRHGVPEHVTSLTAAVASCAPSTCFLPAALIQWLPPAARPDLDQASFVRIVADSRMDKRARFFAAAVLHDIGHDKPLDPASIEALIVAGRQKGDERLFEMVMAAIEDAPGLSRATVVARLNSESEASQYQDVLNPVPLLGRLAKVSTAEDLPLIKRMMERFGSTGSVEAHYAVEAALHVPGESASDILGNWYNRFAALRPHIGLGLARRQGFPRDRLERLAARGDARTQIIVKTILHAPEAQATLLAYLVNGTPEDKFQAASLAAFTPPAGVDQPLRNLLTFQDARYYPSDAALRHAAMESVVRLALTASLPDPATPRPAPAESAPRSP